MRVFEKLVLLLLLLSIIIVGYLWIKDGDEPAKINSISDVLIFLRNYFFMVIIVFTILFIPTSIIYGIYSFLSKKRN